MSLVKNLIFFDERSRRVVEGVVKRTHVLPGGIIRVQLAGVGTFDVRETSYRNGLWYAFPKVRKPVPRFAEPGGSKATSRPKRRQHRREKLA